MDPLTHSLEELQSPSCPNCGIDMRWYRSELIKFVPPTNLHLFNCPACLLFAESETAYHPVWAPFDSFAASRFRFFALAA